MAITAALHEVLAVLESWFPPATAEPWDAVGLVVGDPAAPVRRVLFAVDPVAEVVAEAISWGADLLVTHHPLFLRPVHSVAATSFKGQVAHRLIREGIALFVAHTNADAAERGVADALAAAIGVLDRRPLIPSSAPAADPAVGIGRVGHLPEPITLRALAGRVATMLPPTAQGIRVAGELAAPVQGVAVVGGSGDSLFDAVRSVGADVYVTSDLRHHPASELREQARFEGPVAHPEAGKPFLVDTAHFASEWLWLDRVAADLPPALPGPLTCRVSRLVTDPWTAHFASVGWLASEGFP